MDVPRTRVNYRRFVGRHEALFGIRNRLKCVSSTREGLNTSVARVLKEHGSDHDPLSVRERWAF